MYGGPNHRNDLMNLRFKNTFLRCCLKAASERSHWFKLGIRHDSQALPYNNLENSPKNISALIG